MRTTEIGTYDLAIIVVHFSELEENSEGLKILFGVGSKISI